MDDPGHSDRARRTDLRRWAAAINTVHGRNTGPVQSGSMSGWDSVTTELGDSETLLRALDLLGEELAASSRPTWPARWRRCRFARLWGPPIDPTTVIIFEQRGILRAAQLKAFLDSYDETTGRYDLTLLEPFEPAVPVRTYEMDG